jgi:DNA-binding transcriptional LysR family regulator
MSLISPQLEAFMAVARLKTVHGAAETLHLTQTAVTQRLRSLESRLRTTLFIRTRRGMQLTQEGEALIRYCHTVKALEGETLASMQGAGTQADIELVITGPSSIMSSRIIPACLDVMKKYQHLRLHFDIDDLETRYQKLRIGKADLALVQPEHLAQEMVAKRLRPEQYILVGPAAWKNRKLQKIIATERIIDFDPTDQMTFNYLKAFDLFDMAQYNRCFVNRTEALALMVKAGLGYTTLAKEFAQPYLSDGSCITLNGGKIYEHHYALAWYTRPEPPAYFRAVTAAIY